MSFALIVPAFLLACGFLAVGCALRVKLRVLQTLYVPASVIAGAVGLLFFQWVTWLQADGATSSSAAWLDSLNSIRTELSGWPGWLIAVIFAALLLERPSRSLRDSARLAGREGIVVWIIVLGQTTIGLLMTWLVLGPIFDLPDAFGMLIETGFAGGHGTAAAMGEVFANINMPYGKDLGMMMATVGLVISVTTGILYINIAIRRGLIATPQSSLQANSQAIEHTDNRTNEAKPIAFAKIGSEIMEPMVLQVLFLAAAFGIGLGLQKVVNQISDTLGWEKVLGTFPLFIYTLFGGLATRKLATWVRAGEMIDGPSLQRLVGAAMEFLVVAAIATLNLPAVLAYITPLAILIVAAIVWTAFCLFYLSRWLLPPKYWFQLGLINYGMSTGTTATGFVLLRVVDEHLDSGAAEDYALAAPLSSPFIGGGMVTFGLPVLVLNQVPLGVVCLALIAILGGLFAVAWCLKS